jgi:multiple sugar transport system permease protein
MPDRSRRTAPSLPLWLSPGRWPARYRDFAAVVLFVLPFAVLWFVFMILPILYGFWISLHDWNPLTGSRFIGFGNYAKLFATPRFWSDFRTTIVYSLLVIPMILGFGLLFAVMLHRVRIRGRGLLESVFFLPYLLNVSIISIVWTFLFDPDVGIVNYYLRAIGLDPPTVLNDPLWVLPGIALATAWWLSGYRMVVFSAGLQAIPETLYEAAALDGAGRWRMFRSITMPLLKPSLLFAAVITLVGGMRTFGQVILMTSGGPGTSSEVLALYMYRLAFEFLRFGEAAAVGFILFAVIFVGSLALFRLVGLESHLR